MSSEWLQNKLKQMEESGKVKTYSSGKSAKIMKRMNERLKKTNLEYKIIVRKTHEDPRIYKPLL